MPNPAVLHKPDDTPDDTPALPPRDRSTRSNRMAALVPQIKWRAVHPDGSVIGIYNSRALADYAAHWTDDAGYVELVTGDSNLVYEAECRQIAVALATTPMTFAGEYVRLRRQVEVLTDIVQGLSQMPDLSHEVTQLRADVKRLSYWSAT